LSAPIDGRWSRRGGSCATTRTTTPVACRVGLWSASHVFFRYFRRPLLGPRGKSVTHFRRHRRRRHSTSGPDLPELLFLKRPRGIPYLRPTVGALGALRRLSSCSSSDQSVYLLSPAGAPVMRAESIKWTSAAPGPSLQLAMRVCKAARSHPSVGRMYKADPVCNTATSPQNKLEEDFVRVWVFVNGFWKWTEVRAICSNTPRPLRGPMSHRTTFSAQPEWGASRATSTPRMSSRTLVSIASATADCS